jgi:hypothetical protein
LETRCGNEGIKKTFIATKGNEGIHNAAAKQMPGLASSFSLSEKWTRREGRVRRAQSDRYPDFGLNLASAFPGGL